MPRLYLLDAMALAYRAFHALSRSSLRTSDGEDTGALFGFLSTLLSLIDKEAPERVIVVFDSLDTNWRYELYPAYKSSRKAMPPELASQIPLMIEIAEASGLPVLQPPQTEADDLLATLALRAKDAGFRVFLVSPDKDLCQIVDDAISIYLPSKSGKAGYEAQILDRDGVKAKHGVWPSQIVDYLALLGDSSDDIPGVQGIGEITARKLLDTFGSFDALYRELDRVETPRIRENLRSHEAEARLSKTLVTLKTDLPLSPPLELLLPTPPDKPRLKDLLEDSQLSSFLRRLPTWPDLTRPQGASTSHPDSPAPVAPRPPSTLLTTEPAISAFLADAATAPTLFLHPLLDRDERPCLLLALAFALDPDASHTYILPLLRRQGDDLPLFAAPSDGSLLSPADALLRLKPLLEDPKRPKVGLDLKETLLALQRRGIGLSGLRADLMLAAHLLDAGSPCDSLADLCPRILGFPAPSADVLRGGGRKPLPWHRVPLDALQAFLSQEVALIALLSSALLPKIEGTTLATLLADLEMPFLPVLAAMEAVGIALQTDRFQSLREDLDSRLDLLRSQIAEAAQTPDLNPSSSPQVAEILFEKLQLHTLAGISLKKTKKKTGYTTDSDTLELLRSSHPLPGLILEYRELQKLQSTYIEALPRLAIPPDTPDTLGPWPRVHTSFRQAGTATGRLSSVSPNLQNIPVRTPQGREIRKAFIPGRSDSVLLSADYSQIELRILAHLSDDPRLLDAFEKKVDIHARTASLIFDLPIEAVSPAQRSAAKAINFGILYGMGPPRLASEIAVSQDEAALFIKAWYASFPRVKSWIDQTIQDAKTLGYVQTLFGRRRTIPDLFSADPSRRSAARKIAINTPIQGAAADLIKIAMIRIHRRLLSSDLQARMLLQVHDELLFEVPKAHEADLRALVEDEMPKAYPLRVPLIVSIGVGETWAEAH